MKERVNNNPLLQIVLANRWNHNTNSMEFDETMLDVQILKSEKQVLCYSTDKEKTQINVKEKEKVKKDELDIFKFILTKDGCFSIASISS